MRIKFLLKKFILVSLASSAIIVLSSCSGDESKLIDKLQYFLDNNESITYNDENVKKYPAKLYVDNPETSINTFRLSDGLNEILDTNSLSAKFNYSESQPDGDKIRFNITFLEDNKPVLEGTSVIGGFITLSGYSIKTNAYLQSLNLNESVKNKYELKEFLELKLPKPNEPHEWEKLIDLNYPPGYNIELNPDITTSRYDHKNQQLVIGTFTSQVDYSTEAVKRPLAISITNNFKNPTKPLSVFMVDDSGVNISSLINSEVIFINRTSNNIIKFNQSLDNKRIYKDLDLSHFNNWSLPSGGSVGVFQSNFITSVKLPSNVTEIGPKLFLQNKIINFDTNNQITKINNDSFDENVKFGNLLINKLGLKIFYNLETQTLDFNKKPPFLNNPLKIEDLLELLYLVVRNDSLLIKKIILPGELFQGTDNKVYQNINNLIINVPEVEFVSVNEININDSLSFVKWKISTLIIPQEILSINMNSIKVGRTIKRTINPKVWSLVKGGVLDLRQDISPLVNYKNNLNDYYETGNRQDNIIEFLYLEDSSKTTDSKFENIFKIQSTPSIKNKIHISSKTLVLTGVFMNNTLKNMEITRDIPDDLKQYLVGGHLNLEVQKEPNVFLKEFYLKIMYLRGITQITLPSGITEIPEKAFYYIDLSNIKININIESITKVSNYAFYESKLSGKLSLPNVTVIGASSFFGNNLQEIDLPKVETINSMAFRKNQLKTINLLNLKTIDSYAFDGNQLTTINLPNITRIDRYAFQGNPNLKAVTLNAKTIISKNSFDPSVVVNIDLSNPENYNLIDGLYFVDNLGKKIIDFTKVTGKYTYNNAMNQLNLLIRKDTEIDEMIWNLDLVANQSISDTNVKIIKKLVIKESIKDKAEIPNNLFRDITIREVQGLEYLTKIGDYAFYNSKIEKFNSDELKQPGELTLKSNLISIGNRAFENNNITKLIFEIGSTTNIPSGAFKGNKLLKDIYIPHTIKQVDSYAFDDSCWEYVRRIAYKNNANESAAWRYDDRNNELFFERMIYTSQEILENIRTLNGLKIQKIKFHEDISFIPQAFLRRLMNSLKVEVGKSNIEVELSNILAIEAKAFSEILGGIKISPGTIANIMYNDKDSGIIIPG